MQLPLVCQGRAPSKTAAIIQAQQILTADHRRHRQEANGQRASKCSEIAKLRLKQCPVERDGPGEIDMKYDMEDGQSRDPRRIVSGSHYSK